MQQQTKENATKKKKKEIQIYFNDTRIDLCVTRNKTRNPPMIGLSKISSLREGDK